MDPCSPLGAGRPSLSHECQSRTGGLGSFKLVAKSGTSGDTRSRTTVHGSLTQSAWAAAAAVVVVVVVA